MPLTCYFGKFTNEGDTRYDSRLYDGEKMLPSGRFQTRSLSELALEIRYHCQQREVNRIDIAVHENKNYVPQIQAPDHLEIEALEALCKELQIETCATDEVKKIA